MFEEVNNLSSEFITYNPKRMLDTWLSNTNHFSLIIHPSINELFCKLDEELLIGNKPQLFNVWDVWGATTGISSGTTFLHCRENIVGVEWNVT